MYSVYKKGLGWSVLPYVGLKNAFDISTTRLHWDDKKPVLRSAYLYYYKEMLTHITVKTFIDFIKEYYPNSTEIK